eukprot:scaffold2079_cov173-Ochromonas_danica.AAC.14
MEQKAIVLPSPFFFSPSGKLKSSAAAPLCSVFVNWGFRVLEIGRRDGCEVNVSEPHSVSQKGQSQMKCQGSTFQNHDT